MPKSTTQGKVKVKITIKPGPGSPAQKAAWRRFWLRVINKEGNG